MKLDLGELSVAARSTPRQRQRMNVVPPSALARLAASLTLSLVACGDAETAAGTGASAASSAGGAAVGGSGGTESVGGGSAGGGSGQGAQAAGGAGGEGGSFVPAPIPELDPEPPALCANPEPADYFQFLDDTCGAKRFPSYEDRDLICPSVDTSATITRADGSVVTYEPSSAPVVVHDELSDIVPAGMFVTVILIRRVGGVPHYRYLSNGSHDVAYQPWSTTKVLAAANAASRLRIASNYTVGLTASAGSNRLGDLVTSVCNYDYDPYSSNGLGRYFHDIGGRARANDLIHDLWLERPANETFGGNYGAAAPNLGYSFVESDGSEVTITPDSSSGPANNLSSFTAAEAIKRLVLHREEAEQRLPGIQWSDVETLLYGASDSAKYGTWGGMTRDTAIYHQAGHDPDYIEERSQGQWRTFSKLGFGTSGQFLDIGYSCWPVLDNEGQPIAGYGREFVIAANLPTGGATWAERDRELARAYRAIITRIVDGRL